MLYRSRTISISQSIYRVFGALIDMICVRLQRAGLDVGDYASVSMVLS
jgi:hypothetical protein